MCTSKFLVIIMNAVVGIRINISIKVNVSCRLGNCTFGKLALGLIPIKLPLGKTPLGKYLTF